MWHLFIRIKYPYNGNKEINTIFNEIRIQTADDLKIKNVKT